MLCSRDEDVTFKKFEDVTMRHDSRDDVVLV